MSYRTTKRRQRRRGPPPFSAPRRPSPLHCFRGSARRPVARSRNQSRALFVAAVRTVARTAQRGGSSPAHASRVPRRAAFSPELASRAARRASAFSARPTPLRAASSVIPRPPPVFALRFAAFGGLLRARRFPAPAALLSAPPFRLRRKCGCRKRTPPPPTFCISRPLSPPPPLLWPFIATSSRTPSASRR